MMKPVGYLFGWRWVVASLRGIVATVALLVALSGQAGAQPRGPLQAIAAGDQHALAIVHDVLHYGCGLVWGWGSDWHGQIGNNTGPLAAYFPPARVVGPSAVGYFTGAKAIAAGTAHSLALRSDGTVWSWGDGGHGQLGVNSDNDHHYPVEVHGADNAGVLSDITAVAAGADFSVAVGSDGTVWAWGDNHYGQLGVHSDTEHHYPVEVHGPGNVGFLSGITAVAAGEDFSLALKSDGTVWAWGHNNPYELGNGSLTDSDTPVQVEGSNGAGFLTDIVSIAAGHQFSLAIRRDGTVWAWGDNRYGELGVNNTGGHDYPVQVHGPDNVGVLSGITSVSGGEDHSLAVKDDGTVYAWGRNNHGQLGVHSDNNHPYPVQVHGTGNVGVLSGITSVAAGEFFSLALNSAGTAVFAWGGNSYAQIDASYKDRTYPEQVPYFSGSSPCAASQIPHGAPQLSNVTQSAKRWRLGNALPRYARATPPVGTTFRFTLGLRAQVKFDFTQTVAGRGVGGNCVPTTDKNSRKPHCQRTVVIATLRHQGKAGNNSLHLEGRINRHRWLAPGTYTLKITATANGNQSRPAFLRFTILPAATPTAGSG
jgi:alpha-tubulin suppressor-like RCC1 family protein